MLIYIVPFIVINGIIFLLVTAEPKCTVTIEESDDYLSTEVTIKIDSWFPTKTISVSMANEEIELQKVKGRTYQTTLYKNGTLQVAIVNLNGMTLKQHLIIDMLDDTPPVIEFSEVNDGIVTITFSDSQSGVDPDSIYALDSVDNRFAPLTLDRETMTATFTMDSAGLRIFAEDFAGNKVQGTFTSHIAEDGELIDEE